MDTNYNTSNALTTISSLPYVVVSRTPSTLSRNSSFRSLSSSSFNNVSVTIGNKKTFAPPPKFPKSLNVSKMRILNRKQDILSTLPRYDNVTHSGELLARFSIKALLTKKWRSSFWISYGKNQILFFRSKYDFDEWAASPYITSQQRNNLVKMTVDFKNDIYKPHLGFKMKGYKVSSIKSKYVRDGKTKRMASNFKLEKYRAKGPSTIVIALGGKNVGEVGALHAVMGEMARECGHQTSTEIVDVNEEKSSFGSDYGSIGFSFSNLSTGSTRSMQSTGIQPEHDFDQRDDKNNKDIHGGRQRRNDEGVGVRIMTRMRSRSPSTRARRLREMQDASVSELSFSVNGDRPYTTTPSTLPALPRYKTPIREKPPLAGQYLRSSENWANFE